MQVEGRPVHKIRKCCQYPAIEYSTTLSIGVEQSCVRPCVRQLCLSHFLPCVVTQLEIDQLESVTRPLQGDKLANYSVEIRLFLL